MIQAIAIDDENIALKVIENHAERIPYLQLKASFINAFDAFDYLNREQVDLIFLDINMPDITGIEFLKSLSHKPKVIFTTAYSQYAVESYEHEAVDYLLKPFEFGRFLKAVNKAAEQLKEPNSEHLFVKTGFEHVRIDIPQLLFAKAEGNYVRFVSADQSVMSRMKMAEAEALLTKHQFLKTHRSYLVNPAYIQKVEKHQLTLPGYTVPISQSHYEEVISRL